MMIIVVTMWQKGISHDNRFSLLKVMASPGPDEIHNEGEGKEQRKGDKSHGPVPVCFAGIQYSEKKINKKQKGDQEGE